MTTTLQILIGLIVCLIEEIHDYIQIAFSDGTTLSIFNNYYYDGESIHVLEGKKLAAVERNGDKVTLLFEGDDSLLIGMSDCDYNGPEAIILRQKGKSPVVWN